MIGNPPEAPPAQAIETASSPNSHANETWDTVAKRYQARLSESGFEPEDIPAPESPDFPKFLHSLTGKDPLLAAELSRKMRTFKDHGNLPPTNASAGRNRRRNAKRSAIMRREGQGFVYDKKKAPLYGLAALLLGIAPLMYFLSRPATQAAGIQGLPASQTAKQTDTNPKNAKVTTGKPTDSGAKETGPIGEAPGTGAGAKAGVGTGTGGPVKPKGKDNLTAFAGEQGTGGAAPKSASNKGITITPPVVPSPPVSSAPTPSPVSDVYRPVAASPTQSFGSTIPAQQAVPQPAPIAYEPPPPAPIAYEPPPYVPEEPAPVAPAPVVAATSPAPFAAEAAPQTAVQATPRTTAQATPKASPRTAPKASPRTAAPAPAATRTQAAPFGSDVNQSAPSGNTAQVAYAPPARRASNGLIYERQRPETPQGSTEPAAIAAAPASVESAAPVAGEGMTFGGMGSSTSGGGDVVAQNVVPAETPFGGTATNAASKLGALGPYKNLQQVPVRLVTAVYALTGGSVPVVVVTADGGSFVGVGTINGQLARVDMTFRRYIDAKGQVFEIDALAYSVEGKNLTQGVPARIEPIAPTLALDAAQNGANALQGAVQSALNANASNGPKIAIGDGAAIASNALPPLWQILAGGVGETFALPKATQSITRAAKVDSNTQLTLIIGIGAGQ